MAESAARTWLCRRIHRLAHALDRLGWWLRDPAEHRLNKRLKAQAAAAQIDGDLSGGRLEP